MKNKFLFVIVSICLISCSSKSKIIENFLVMEMIENEKKNNILIKEKISYIYSRASFVPMNISPILPEKSKIYQYLDKKYGNKDNKWRMFDEQKWEKKEFKKINFILISQDSLNLFVNSNPILANNSNSYYISNPFFYKEKGNQYVFFTVRFCKKIYCRNPVYDDVIILKKNNREWEFVERRPSPFL